ncbi:MAG: glycoside hydrolase family 99-like domain-containing protein, partial [Bacteroidetes bacterium]|nr:glycoside hydrolase family 99-like domain-containing protein [Bacteroidota bacterium]
EEPLTHYFRIGKSLGNKPKKESQNYFDYLNDQNLNVNYKKDYVDFKTHAPVATDLKLIAFYLPQFHPVDVNDKAWGKGFTEWTNVSKAIPQFDGHYQPRLPGELGYYDLRLIDIQKRQIELAKNYGLHGFCYHYYWFDGKKVMDKPLQQILDNPELNFPFCINWANENWTKRWDGLENDVILKQKHSKEDDIAFLEGIKPILLDKRYIKINGKPLLMVYRPQLFPDIKATVKRWREHAKKIGMGELYLVLTHAFDPVDPKEMGFDAACEFAPNSFPVKDITNSIDPYSVNYEGKLFDYKSLTNYSISYKEPAYTKFRGICPSWDNEARKPGKATAFYNTSPQNYMHWLEHLCYYTQEKRSTDEKIIFINAWNEWAEGVYLEPDRKYGYAYLEATHTILKKFDAPKLKALKETQVINKTADIAVVLHLFYVDLWEEMKKELKNFNKPIDLYININNNATIKEIEKIKKDYPKAKIYSFENRGRDILPFLKILKIILPLNYSAICKIHTKKSPHRDDGNEWRNSLIKGLIGTPERINQSIKLLEKDTGIVVSKGNLYSYKMWIGSNAELVEDFAKKANIQIPDDFMFPAGAMFWIKPKVFQKIVDHMDEKDFFVEEGHLDGTIAHACERIVGLLCIESNLKIEEI